MKPARRAVTLLITGLAIAGGCETRTVNIPVGGATSFTVTGTVGRQGGRLRVDDPANPAFGTELVVPADAVDEETEISIAPVEQATAPPFGYRPAGVTVQLNVPELAREATLRLPLQIDARAGEALVGLLRSDGADGWTPLTAAVLDDGTRRGAVQSRSFGLLLLAATPAQVAGDGGPVDDGGGPPADVPQGLNDVSPPSFAGLGSVRNQGNQVILSWPEATDDQTPAGGIRYRIYVPSFGTVGTLVGETPPGEVGATLPATPGVRYYFLVRAVDAAGNEDSNLQVRSVAVPALNDGGPDLPDLRADVADLPIDVADLPADLTADVPGDVTAEPDVAPDMLPPCSNPVSPGSVGRVGYWAGNGDATDSSGNGNHGSAVGGSVAFAGGQLGQAFSFDGLGGHIEIPDAALLNPPTAVSFSARIRLEGAPGTIYDLISKDGEGSERQLLLTVNFDNTIRAHITTTQGFTYINGTTAVQPGTWYTVAMRFDGTSLDVFVNGFREATLPLGGTLPATTQPIRIGGGAPSPFSGYFFPGLIDDVRLYDRALTDSEICGL